MKRLRSNGISRSRLLKADGKGFNPSLRGTPALASFGQLLTWPFLDSIRLRHTTCAAAFVTLREITEFCNYRVRMLQEQIAVRFDDQRRLQCKIQAVCEESSEFVHVREFQSLRLMSVALLPVDDFHRLAGKRFLYITAVIPNRDTAADGRVTKG